MIVPIPFVHIGLGALISIIAIPLVLRRVPMNRSYGIRIREAFVSEENWYAVNAYGGKLLLGFGIFLFVFGIAARWFAPAPQSPLAPVFLGLPLLVIFPVLARIRSFARRLTSRSRRPGSPSRSSSERCSAGSAGPGAGTSSG